MGELQYGATVSIGEGVPEENHHPLLLIEIPRMIFPYVRQIMSDLTVQGGFPPLLLNPVDFHALYMSRFGAEIEAAQKEAAEAAKN
jgi:preprotein translocase subunit SecB